VADCKKLRDPHLNVSAHPAYGELARTIENVRNESPVETLDGLRELLDDLITCPRHTAITRARTLDLIGHADQRRLLQLGRSIIDPTSQEVRQFFERMAADRVLETLRIGELRLLGCETAMSREGQRAIRELTDILEVRVVGTTKLVYSAYFGEKGLKDRYERMLRDASNLPDLTAERTEWPLDPLPALAPPFDLERLETVAVDELPPAPWPRLEAAADLGSGPVSPGEIQLLVDLVDGEDGRVMSRMLAQPSCELLLPCGPDRVRQIEILFDFELVRVHSVDGATAIYRVTSPRELGAWVSSIGQPCVGCA
jgi:hypothetical protein